MRERLAENGLNGRPIDTVAVMLTPACIARSATAPILALISGPFSIPDSPSMPISTVSSKAALTATAHSKHSALDAFDGDRSAAPLSAKDGAEIAGAERELLDAQFVRTHAPQKRIARRQYGETVGGRRSG